MKSILEHARETAVLFMLLLLVFRAIEQFRPTALRVPLLRRGRLNDLAWWVIGPLVSQNLGRIAAFLAVIPVGLLAYGRLDANLIGHGFGPMARLPLWAQAPLLLICGDFVGYWVHRAFHGRRLWRFHAVHHATEALDWMSAVRNHPLNEAITRAATTLPVVALGFAPVAVGGISAVLGLLALVVHANVDWDWGPFRAVLISPRFHRWHHEIVAGDRNFAGLFPIWDILFGTWYMPKDTCPRRFGTDTAVPRGVIGQLLFPFRRARAESVMPKGEPAEI